MQHGHYIDIKSASEWVDAAFCPVPFRIRKCFTLSLKHDPQKQEGYCCIRCSLTKLISIQFLSSLDFILRWKSLSLIQFWKQNKKRLHLISEEVQKSSCKLERRFFRDDVKIQEGVDIFCEWGCGTLWSLHVSANGQEMMKEGNEYCHLCLVNWAVYM